MQQPVGYVLRNGRAEMDDFWALITNPHVFVQFPHVITGAMATGGFFVLGISAWHLRRAKDAETRDAFGRSFRIGAVYGLVGTLAVMVVGHTQAQYMVAIQPMKMAAAEALWETEDPAPMSLFTWGDETERAGRLRDQGARPAQLPRLQPLHGRGEGHQGPPGRVRAAVRPGRLRAARASGPTGASARWSARASADARPRRVGASSELA